MNLTFLTQYFHGKFIPSDRAKKKTPSKKLLSQQIKKYKTVNQRTKSGLLR